MSGLVKVATFGNRPEAEIAKGMLEANGTRTVLSADDAGGWRPELTFTMGVRLLVAEDDVEVARELLDGTRDGGRQDS